ncbi:putative quinol monooxygenase [Tumebacillus lipolyticus]|uniref:Quinol monooxygenase n=1 Tax=Tumebacillus lipolyticus TaxID=1280370 RepID=A0ABW4ZS08_9BACL
MVIIHAYLVVNPKHREQFLQLARHITSGSQAEEGNISYRLYEDAERSDAFVIVEKWKDHQAIAHHNQTDHFKSFIRDVKGLLEEEQVEVYDVVTNP